jgi:hypothetical protein
LLPYGWQLPILIIHFSGPLLTHAGCGPPVHSSPLSARSRADFCATFVLPFSQNKRGPLDLILVATFASRSAQDRNWTYVICLRGDTRPRASSAFRACHTPRDLCLNGRARPIIEHHLSLRLSLLLPSQMLSVKSESRAGSVADTLLICCLLRHACMRASGRHWSSSGLIGFVPFLVCA